MIPKVEQSAHNILIDTRQMLEMYSQVQAKKTLHIGSENIFAFFLTIALQKRSPLGKPINYA